MKITKTITLSALLVSIVLLPATFSSAGTAEEVAEKLVSGSPWLGHWDRGEVDFSFFKSSNGRLMGELLRQTGSPTGSMPGPLKWVEVSKEGEVTFTTPFGTDVKLRLNDGGDLVGTWKYNSSGWVKLSPRKN